MRQKLRTELLAPTVPAPTCLTRDDIMELAKVSRATLDRAIAEGLFPQPTLSFGVRTQRWLTQDYLDWIERARAAQHTEQPRIRGGRNGGVDQRHRARGWSDDQQAGR